MKIWIGLWVASIIISFIILATNPKRNDVAEKVQRYRTIAIVAGFVPCFGFSIFAQIVYLVMYRAKLTMAVSTRSKLSAGLPTDFGTPQNRAVPPSAGTPDTQPPSSRPTSSDNPFL